MAVEMFSIAREGLHRQCLTDGQGRDEAIYLGTMADNADAGRSPADEIIAGWQGDWKGDVRRLIEYAAYKHTSA